MLAKSNKTVIFHHQKLLVDPQNLLKPVDILNFDKTEA